LNLFLDEGFWEIYYTREVLDSKSFSNLLFSFIVLKHRLVFILNSLPLRVLLALAQMHQNICLILINLLFQILDGQEIGGANLRNHNIRIFLGLDSLEPGYLIFQVSSDLKIIFLVEEHCWEFIDFQELANGTI
jgi:hypothetical protein